MIFPFLCVIIKIGFNNRYCIGEGIISLAEGKFDWRNKMEKQNKSFFTARNITALAVLLALVIVLQIFASGIKIGAVTISLTLVPIVVGAMVLGPLAGAFLGFAFGLVTLIAGITGADPFTYVLFTDHPLLTAATCLVKGTAAGFVSGLVFKTITNKKVSTFVAAAVAPVVNTSLFILGALFMSDTLSANFVADGQSVFYFLVIGCAGVNFLTELGINLILAPSVFTVYRLVENKF